VTKRRFQIRRFTELKFEELLVPAIPGNPVWHELKIMGDDEKIHLAWR
jgi:hypothetical protein